MVLSAILFSVVCFCVSSVVLWICICVLFGASPVQAQVSFITVLRNIPALLFCVELEAFPLHHHKHKLYKQHWSVLIECESIGRHVRWVSTSSWFIVVHADLSESGVVVMWKAPTLATSDADCLKHVMEMQQGTLTHPQYHQPQRISHFCHPWTEHCRFRLSQYWRVVLWCFAGASCSLPSRSTPLRLFSVCPPLCRYIYI